MDTGPRLFTAYPGQLRACLARPKVLEALRYSELWAVNLPGRRSSPCLPGPGTSCTALVPAAASRGITTAWSSVVNSRPSGPRSLRVPAVIWLLVRTLLVAAALGWLSWILRPV